jgi:phage-related protein
MLNETTINDKAGGIYLWGNGLTTFVGSVLLLSNELDEMGTRLPGQGKAYKYYHALNK